MDVITFGIQLIVLAVILGLVWWCVSKLMAAFNLPAPIPTVVMVIFVLVVVLALAGVFLGGGHPVFHWR